MRASTLQKLNTEQAFKVIDTNIPYSACHRLFRSIGFRYKSGPLIEKINQYVINQLPKQDLSYCWIDKGVYLTQNTTQKIRNKTNKLIHYTPDPAFYLHSSHHFNQSLPLYDYIITTKSYELDFYKSFVSENKIVLTHQGFDPDTHYPTESFSEKSGDVVYIGHYEKNHASILQAILDTGFTVGLAGINWQPFYFRNRLNKNLRYWGKGIWGKDYSKVIHAHLFGLGLLSQWVPELHTSRTFEIPACGTALLTRENEETKQFFDSSQVVFFSSINNLLSQIDYYKKNKSELETLTNNGRRQLFEIGVDYPSQLSKLLCQIK